MTERARGSDALTSPTLATFGVVVVAVIGGSVIAEPIAMARIGAIPGSLVLLVMGLMNYVAITALAGAAARSSSVFVGRGRFTRLVEEHLGVFAAKASGVASLLLWFGITVVYLLGFGGTLAEVVGGSAAWWSIGLGVVVCVVVAANARRLFVRAASSVATINVVLLVVLMVVALLEFKWHLFTNIPFLHDATDAAKSAGQVARPTGLTAGTADHFERIQESMPVISTVPVVPESEGSLRENLDLVFGTALFVFAGQTAVFSVAPEVMRADPSGRSLVRGSQYALIAAIVMNAGWVLAALSAVPHSKFLDVRSLGVEVIGSAIGGPAKILATTVVLLGFSVGTVNSAFAMADVVTERLPTQRKFEVLLRPGISIEVEEPSVNARLVVTVVTVDGRMTLIARARNPERSEWTYISGDQWEATSLLSRFGKVPAHRWLRVTVLGESAVGIAVQAEGTMHVDFWPPPNAVWWNDQLTQVEARAVQALMRAPLDEDGLATTMAISRADADAIVARLFTVGAVSRGTDGDIRPVLGHRHRARSSIVADLFADLTGASRWSEVNRSSRLGNPVLKVLFRGLVTAVPIVTAALLEVFGVSFGRALGLVAIGTLVLLQGTLPVLVGLSLRHRAERRLPFSRFFMPAWVVVSIVTFFMFVCGAYAVVIYQAWPERIVAALSLAMCVGVVMAARRHGAFRDRTSVTLELASDGALRAIALVGARERQVVLPSRLEPTDRALEITVHGPLSSPVVVRAISGDVAPARLGNWQVVATSAWVDRGLASGLQMSIDGEVIDLPDDEVSAIKVRWAVI